MFELSKAFDANYYSTMNPDLAAAGLVSPEALFNHFITFGIDEGRGFSPYIDISYYAAVNQDLTAAGLSGNRQFLDHLIAYGVNEKRLFSPNVDLNFYAAANQDLGAAGLTTGQQLFDHLINFGVNEGRQLVNTPTPDSEPEPPDIQPPDPELPTPPGGPGLPGLPTLQTQNFAGGMLLGGSSSIAPESQDVNQLVAQGLAVATEQLKDFLADPDFATKIATTFGEGVDLASVNNLITQLANAQDLPKIEILSVENIGGVSGAFDPLTNTVYVSQQFLLQNGNNPQAIASVLLEEIGHSIDSRVNAVDAPGDEGQIFAAFVQGNNLSQADVLALQSENDRATLTVNGQSISVELSSFDYANKWATDTWDWSSGSSQYLGAYDYGSNTRTDGKKGFIADWGSGSPTNSVPNDYFLLGLWTQADFQAGKTYEFSVRADDGFLVAALPVNGDNWSLVTPWEEWQQAYGSHQKYQWTPNSSGKYWILSYFYEAGGNAYLDLSWNESNGKNYYPQLSSLSESEWDIQSGDDNQFRPDSPYGGGDQRWKTDDRIEQIYTDLSNAIFGDRVHMNTGYAYDQGYYSAFGTWHAGLDMNAGYQTPIKAAVGGTVQWISGSGDGYVFVGINSDDGRQWVYGHLQSQNGLWQGKRINAGEDVGLVGWYGGAPHLHLEVQNGLAYGKTQGAMTNRDTLLGVTVSPLMAYWQWRNQ